MFFLALAAVVAVLLTQWAVAGRLSTTAMVVVRFQATFWTISYAVVPLVMFLMQPRRGNPLYDVRLALTSYDALLSTVLGVVAVSQLGFLLGLLLWIRFIGPQLEHELRDLSTDQRLACIVVLFIGWASRVCTLIGGSIASVGRVGAPFGLVAACLIITQLKATGRDRVVLVVVFFGEVLWSALDASKTPLIAATSALVVRWSLSLGRRRLFRLVPFAIGLMIVGFLVIQPLKGIDTAERSSEYVGAGNDSVVIGNALSLFERFDGTATVTDAVTYSFGPWLKPSEYLSRVIGGFIPRAVTGTQQDASVGVVWTREVRTRTVSGQYQGVAIAAGPVAEGYAVGGLAGGILACLTFALVTVAVARLIESTGIFLRFIGASFVFGGILYEQALIGISNTVPKALEVAILAGVSLMLIRGGFNVGNLREMGHGSAQVALLEKAP